MAHVILITTSRRRCLRGNGWQRLRGDSMRSATRSPSSHRQQQLPQDLPIRHKHLPRPHRSGHRCQHSLGALPLQGQHVQTARGARYQPADIRQPRQFELVRAPVWTVVCEPCCGGYQWHDRKAVHLRVRSHMIDLYGVSAPSLTHLTQIRQHRLHRLRKGLHRIRYRLGSALRYLRGSVGTRSRPRGPFRDHLPSSPQRRRSRCSFRMGSTCVHH